MSPSGGPTVSWTLRFWFLTGLSQSPAYDNPILGFSYTKDYAERLCYEMVNERELTGIKHRIGWNGIAVYW